MLSPLRRDRSRSCLDISKRPTCDMLRPDSQRTLLSGTLLQFALRAVLAVFVVVTVLCEPPNRYLWICVAVLAVYAVVIGCWSVWALRTAARAGSHTSTPLTLL